MMNMRNNRVLLPVVLVLFLTRSNVKVHADWNHAATDDDFVADGDTEHQVSEAVFEDDYYEDPSHECGLWMGPSHIKAREKHGFGLGIFTAKEIRKGTVFDPEVFVPIFDYNEDPLTPFREYLWYGGASDGEEERNKIALESHRNFLFFLPGLASVAPCTMEGYNVEQIHRIVNHLGNDMPHRSRDATAGSFSYRQDSMFTAARHIAAGEELVVGCTDDEFRAGAYKLSRFDKDDRGIICLDDKVQVQTSRIPKAGKGLFAKRHISKGTVILSSMVLPVMKQEMNVNFTFMRETNHNDEEEYPQRNPQHLLLNYAYGHPNSDLLLLPYGSMVNYLNHHDTQHNVELQWHESDYDNDQLDRRQQHHHPELFESPAAQVAQTYGKGLVVDYVATRDIQAGQELYLDYGDEWNNQWKRHKDSFVKGDARYVSAAEYNQKQEPTIRTTTEQDRDPYPPNLETACWYHEDWVDPETFEKGKTYNSYDEDESHNCLLPCLVLERKQQQDGNDAHVYTAQLLDKAHSQNEDITYDCHLLEGYEYIYEDIPRDGIVFVDKPYSTDDFWTGAFRQPIGVPEDFYPMTWWRKRLRSGSSSRKGGIKEQDEEDDQEFQRKEIRPLGENIKEPIREDL